MLNRNPAWFRALTLAERARLPLHPAASDDAAATARGREDRWRAEPPFASTPELLSEHLQAAGVDSQTWMNVLAATEEELAHACASDPEWLRSAVRSFERFAPSDKAGTWTPELAQESGGRGGTIAFLQAAAPFLQDALREVDGVAEALGRAYPAAPFDPERVSALLMEALVGALMPRLLRTMVLEVNVARLQGLLAGDTPEERFAAFSARLRDPAVLHALYDEYPVLGRVLVDAATGWARLAGEVLERLCADWDAIAARFFPHGAPGRLTALAMGAGDSHRGGRSVCLLSFEGGASLVYKPHSLAVDEHFAALVRWVNDRTGVGVRSLEVLDRHDYGWQEFAHARPCATAAEVARFYERQGGLLALLYVLEATDCHLENLIACGDDPVLVDVESLFHPRQVATAVDTHPAGQAVTYSVLRSALLPLYSWAADGEMVDVSAMGGRGGQLTPRPMVTFERHGTDEMHVVRRRLEMPPGVNRPRVEERYADPLEFVDGIVSGFRRVYDAIMAARAEWLLPGGCIDRFANVEVRAILRPTRYYGMLLGESYHPDVLRDALDRERLFGRLWRDTLRVPALKAAVPHEIVDMRRGDIPLFTCRPGSTSVWSSDGVELPGYYPEPAIDAVRRRVGELSEREREQQVWFIRASVATLRQVGHDQVAALHPGTPAEAFADTPALAPDDFLRLAREVGDRLEALAVRAGGKAGWVGLALVGEKYWMLRPVGADLYDGATGIALFLGYLGAATGEERYTRLAREALEPVVEVARMVPEMAGNMVGAFAGLAGPIYAFSHLGVLWEDPELLDEALELAELVGESARTDARLDIISGAAGAICALESLLAATGDASVLDAIRAAADRLVETAVPQAAGCGWQTNIESAGPLAGLSHGAAGVAYALGRAAALTGDERYLETVAGALAYERSTFVPAEGNWPDLRTMPGASDFMCTWCHGAPGVGLSRLGVLEQLDTPEVRAEIETALQTTRASGFGGSHCICHGDLGNLELFLEGARVLGRDDLLGEARRLATHMALTRPGGEWQCGVPMGVTTPGLMMGVAGIGYQLLRLADPAVPSVLLLAPPARVAVAASR